MHSRQVLSAGGESRRISWWDVGGRLVMAEAGKPEWEEQWNGAVQWWYYMLILIGFANAGQCSARVEWICRVSLRVGDWLRRGVETGNANADKARELSVSATSWLQGGCRAAAAAQITPAITR